MNVLGYRFRDDIPNRLAAFEEPYTTTKPIRKDRRHDSKIRVTMLGMEDVRVKEHFIRTNVRITSWNQMREEILEITRTQQDIDSQPSPMQLRANPKIKCESGCAYHGITDFVTNMLMKVQHVAVSETVFTTLVCFLQ